MGSSKHLNVSKTRQVHHHRWGEGRTQAVIDAIPAHIAFIDRCGEIVSVNYAWVDSAHAYRIHTDLSASLQVFAERVGSLDGGPRHIVDLHSEVLTDQVTTERGPQAQALTDEARLLLAKSLSYLAA